LSDALGVVEVAVGTLALGATFIVYKWQLQCRGLGVVVLTNRPLISTPSPFPVTMSHDGRFAIEPWIIVLRVANTGNVPIQADDFVVPLSVTFPVGELLSAEITGLHPRELAASLRTDHQSVTLEPCLLNPSDLIEIQCLLDGANLGVEDPHAACRVVGVKSVRIATVPRDSWGKAWRISTAEFVVMALLGGAAILGGVVVLILGGPVILALALLLFGAAMGWYDLNAFRRSRLWLHLPPPDGH
jgi:hypothetical protein